MGGIYSTHVTCRKIQIVIKPDENNYGVFRRRQKDYTKIQELEGRV
jgi:hypothetical protein